MRELPVDSAAEMPPGERRRGPVRNIVWVTLRAGTREAYGTRSALAAGGPPLPLTSGMWIEAGPSACGVVGSAAMPDADVLWRAVDQFHLGVMARIRDRLARDVRPGNRNAWFAAAISRRRRHSNPSTAFLRSSCRRSDHAADRRQTRRIPCSPPAGSSRKRIGRRLIVASRPPRPDRNSPTLSRSREPHDCGFARRCCEANGGSRMSARWWPGTASERDPVALIRGARASLHHDRAAGPERAVAVDQLACRWNWPRKR